MIFFTAIYYHLLLRYRSVSSSTPSQNRLADGRAHSVKVKKGASKTIDIWKLPPVLVVHLQRYTVTFSKLYTCQHDLFSSCCQMFILNQITTVKLFGSTHFLFQTLKLFSISPATIFFLAPYSESFFCALTFSDIYYCMEYSFLVAGTIFSASGLARSNGLVNIGFGCSFALKTSLSMKQKWGSLPILVSKAVLSILVPFLCYQYYAFINCFFTSPT